jgi:hypothetical protein
MFESRTRLAQEIAGLLKALREEAEGRYACLVDRKTVVFEDAAEGSTGWDLRQFLDERREVLFTLPAAMAGEGPEADLFEDWSQDDFFLAFLNGKVAVVVACPDAEALRQPAQRLLRALSDRLFRFEPTYRLDASGRGFFGGRAQLDVVVVARGGPESLS